MQRLHSALAVTTLSLIGLLGASSAHAVTCSVNIERAYQEAVKRGWTFWCTAVSGAITGSKSGLHFDKSKRLGCYGRTGPVLAGSQRFIGHFFIKGSHSTTQLSGGWSIASFQIADGQWSQAGQAGGSRIDFEWSYNLPNKVTYRHLSQLKVTKSGGNCAKFYDEAFN